MSKEVNQEEYAPRTIADVKEMLSKHSNGEIQRTIRNCELILQNDHVLANAIRLNLLSERIDIVKPVGWPRSGKALNDTDMKYILRRMEKYGISSEKKIESAIRIVANENRYHPIRDYLNSLKWDGTERIAHVLHHFLGAAEDDYTCEAMKIFLLGAIKRVFQPGCKFETMEKSAIKKGFAELKPGEAYDALYASALCRAKADWIIGINATRLFSVLHGKTLNVGRVQTPTLKMLADRDAAITSFKKETYHIVRLDVGGAEAVSARISDAADAEALKTACEASQAICISVRRERKTEQPPRLFDLTDLQREANRIYGYTAKQTLDLAQALYEKRLLTYPRTDSNYLTDDMGDTAVHIAALLVGKLPFMKGAAFTPDIARTLDSKKVSDHHAIIPTMELAKADLAALPESERNILTLAGARLLFAAAEPHIFDPEAHLPAYPAAHPRGWLRRGRNLY